MERIKLVSERILDLILVKENGKEEGYDLRKSNYEQLISLNKNSSIHKNSSRNLIYLERFTYTVCVYEGQNVFSSVQNTTSDNTTDSFPF
jgi:hypothetical protein